MSSVMMFDFEEKPVRAFMRDGQEWFVAADVCRCLDIGNSRQALSRMSEDEKGVTTNDTLGGTQEMSCVNEPGLFRLIFESRKPEAERLKRFVFHEVLPALRKTGAFAVEPAPEPVWEVIREKLAMVREVRLTRGKAAASALWTELGLPTGSEEASSPPQRTGMMKHIFDFIDECTVKDGKSEVSSNALHQRYQQWASANGAPYIVSSSFGKWLVQTGLPRRRSGGSIYTGIRILTPSEVGVR
ncbi:BRO family protein [Rhizobium sp. P007]|uniref:anti-repressor Ant n=1 Tax=Rhizobium phage RR1-A TaxID=929833 RepID=UPI0003428290|nr:BRO family protein [Rhizobium sp. P007]YP_008130212.1 anti-repressor Ant [Rhizobium phage RR1-A]AGN34441.1 antirepressor [Rhizobium phage RR1-A]CAD7058648.1 Prophage antirepressor protein [Rhizobium sp. P007]